MRKIVVGLLMGLLICVAGIAIWYFLPKVVEQIVPMIVIDRPVDQPEWDFPRGDTTPEHLAQVLGSWERYEELRNSSLLKPIWISPDEQATKLEIIRDMSGTWVRTTMHGEVVKIKGRIITIINEGETISLYVPGRVSVETDETERFVDGEGKLVYKD